MHVINPIQSDSLRNLYIRQTKNDSKDSFIIAEVIRFGRFTTTNLSDENILNSYEKEMLLDRLNGLIGKTVIHPKQITLVQLFSVVSYEDYLDAKAILSNTDNKFGALGSLNSDRMNEVKPHLKWAKKIITLASIYGVYNEGFSFRNALQELQKFD